MNMKINKLNIVLIIVIIFLVGYIIYDKFMINNESVNLKEEEITLKEELNLEYVNIYLLSDGSSYISPINEEEIKNIDGGKNLKERLTTLYNRAFYYDIYINNYKLKGFLVNINEKIESIRKIEIDDYIYIVFIKEDNTIGLFDYDKYYNFLYTDVTDNYKNLENILAIEDNKIIYLDGSSSNLVDIF